MPTGVFNAKSFGALGDGVTTDSIAIYDTISSAEDWYNNTGFTPTVFFDAGHYKINIPIRIRCPLTFTGNDFLIKNAIDGGISNAIEVYRDDLSVLTGVSLRNFTVVVSSVPQLHGIAIKLINVSNINIDAVGTYGHPYGISVHGISQGFFNNIRLYYGGQSIPIDGDESSLLSFHLNPGVSEESAGWTTTSITNFLIGGSTKVGCGISIECADGLQFNNGYTYGFKHASLYLNPKATDTFTYVVGNVQFNNVYFDNPIEAEHSVYVPPYINQITGSVQNIRFTNCCFNASIFGMRIDSDITLDITLSNCKFMFHQQSAIHNISKSAQLTVTACTFISCSQSLVDGKFVYISPTQLSYSKIIFSKNNFVTFKNTDTGLYVRGYYDYGGTVITDNAFSNFGPGKELDVLKDETLSEHFQTGNITNNTIKIPTIPDYQIRCVLWTPNIFFSGGNENITYADIPIRSGSFQKIGDFCFVTGWLQLTNKGTSVGNLEILLPVSSYTSDVSGASPFSLKTVGVTYVGELQTSTSANGRKLEFFYATENGGSYRITNVNVSNNAIIEFSGFYRYR